MLRAQHLLGIRRRKDTALCLRDLDLPVSDSQKTNGLTKVVGVATGGEDAVRARQEARILQKKQDTSPADDIYENVR